MSASARFTPSGFSPYRHHEIPARILVLPVPFSPTIAVMPSIAGVNVLSVIPRKYFKDAVISFIHAIVVAGDNAVKTTLSDVPLFTVKIQETPPTWQEVGAQSHLAATILTPNVHAAGCPGKRFSTGKPGGVRTAFGFLYGMKNQPNATTIAQRTRTAQANKARNRKKETKLTRRTHQT